MPFALAEQDNLNYWKTLRVSVADAVLYKVPIC